MKFIWNILIFSCCFNLSQTNAQKTCIGEIFGGGIILVFMKLLGNQHGLIASLRFKLLALGVPDLAVPNCSSSWDSASNTKLLLPQVENLICNWPMCFLLFSRLF